VTITYDSFADRMLIDGLKDFGPALDDGAVTRIWLQLDRRFHFRPGKNLLFDVIKDAAKLNSFHPVRDYLDNLTWDGEKWLDTWLTDYAGAENTPYTRAVGTLLLVAAVRRVRRPGCKFDEMPVFESPQGTNKSIGLETMAVRKDWYSDDLPLNAESRRVIEAMRGRWIVEAAELSGMRHADVEHLKAFLSRTVDRARMSYDRINTEYLRQNIVVGTTNAGTYLRDTTGNRRYWPVGITQFNLVALERDRDQLWAEAAVREAAGESIRLDPALYAAAADEQTQREVDEPYVDALRSALGDMKGRIAAQSIWVILDLKEGARAQMHNQRMGEAMRKLGWRRPNKAGLISIEGKMVSGYVKGEQPWKPIKAVRSFDRDTGMHNLNVSHIDDGDGAAPARKADDDEDTIPF
jgi:predicted P-loop ATPase